MISRETAQRHAAKAGYEDYRDWAADNDNAVCSQCLGVGSHDEMHFAADINDSSLYCDKCWDGIVDAAVAAHVDAQEQAMSDSIMQGYDE